MHRALIIIYFFCFSTLSALAQSGIRCNIQSLAEITLSKSPVIQQNALQIDEANANIQAALSAFDLYLSAGANVNSTNTHLVDDDPRNQYMGSNLINRYGDFFVSSQKRFRTGTTAIIKTGYTGISDNYPFNSFNKQVSPYTTNHQSSVTLTLTQPLLKGNGIKANNALLNAAKLEMEGTKYSFALNTSQELLQMGAAYWEYVSAYKTLEVFRQNENRVRDVLNMTDELVKADKKPQGDLLQVKADLAEQERQTKIAEQNVFNAKINLGKIIGLSQKQSIAIGIPEDDFPVVSDDMKSLALTPLQAIAGKNRPDIKSYEKINEAIYQQLINTRNSLRPALDLTGFATYGGVAFGGGLNQYFHSFSNYPGRNYILGLGLTFTFPVNNNLARANLAKGKIVEKDQQIALSNLERNIELSVSMAHNNLLNSISILEKAKESVGYSEQVFKNEQTKFQNGLTTLLNLILFQERLTQSQLQYIQAQQGFSTAIISLRFETGTLISTGNGVINAVDKTRFYTIPDNK